MTQYTWKVGDLVAYHMLRHGGSEMVPATIRGVTASGNAALTRGKTHVEGLFNTKGHKRGRPQWSGERIEPWTALHDKEWAERRRAALHRVVNEALDRLGAYAPDEIKAALDICIEERAKK